MLRVNDAIAGRLKSKLQAASSLNKTLKTLNRLSANAKVHPDGEAAAEAASPAPDEADAAGAGQHAGIEA